MSKMTNNDYELLEMAMETTYASSIRSYIEEADTKHQSMFSLSAKIFCSRLPQSEIGYSTKNLYRLFGLLPYWATIFQST